jgi:hypothetical protein
MAGAGVGVGRDSIDDEGSVYDDGDSGFDDRGRSFATSRISLSSGDWERSYSVGSFSGTLSGRTTPLTGAGVAVRQSFSSERRGSTASLQGQHVSAVALPPISFPALPAYTAVIADAADDSGATGGSAVLSVTAVGSSGGSGDSSATAGAATPLSSASDALASRGVAAAAVASRGRFASFSGSVSLAKPSRVVLHVRNEELAIQGMVAEMKRRYETVAAHAAPGAPTAPAPAPSSSSEVAVASVAASVVPATSSAAAAALVVEGPSATPMPPPPPFTTPVTMPARSPTSPDSLMGDFAASASVASRSRSQSQARSVDGHSAFEGSDGFSFR